MARQQQEVQSSILTEISFCLLFFSFSYGIFIGYYTFVLFIYIANVFLDL